METQYDEALTSLIATGYKLEEEEKSLAIADQGFIKLINNFIS